MLLLSFFKAAKVIFFKFSEAWFFNKLSIFINNWKYFPSEIDFLYFCSIFIIDKKWSFLIESEKKRRESCGFYSVPFPPLH